MLLLALVAIILIALVTLRSRPPAIANAITITFLGYTNAPGGNWRFALFSISNQAPYTVRGYEDWVEVDGLPDYKGPATHPGPMRQPELKAHRSMLMAIGEPYGQPEIPEGGRWRFAMAFARYTWRTWWLDEAFRGRLPLRVDAGRVLNATNRVTVTTAWLTK
jgi:hypothetical protein